MPADAALVAEPAVGVAVREGGTGDAGGVLGNGWDEAKLERHGATSGRAAAMWCKLLHYIALPDRSEFASSIRLAD